MNTNGQLDIGVVGLVTYGLHRAKILEEFGHRLYGADPSLETLGDIAPKFEGGLYEQRAELFEEDIDALVITTPNKFHEPVAVDAMKQGIDVFIEKPLAHSLESAERITEVAAETGQVCMIGFQSRFINVCNILKWYIDEGKLGEITHIEASYTRRRGVPGRGSWYTSDEIAGGGAVIDIGIHVFDLLFYFLDSPAVTNLVSSTRCDFGHRESYAYLDMWGEDDEAKMFNVEDAASGFIEFDDGTTASIEIAWATNAEPEHAYYIHGTEMGARLDITDIVDSEADVVQMLDFFSVESGGADHFLDISVTTDQNDPYREQMREFTEAVQTREQPSINTPEQALDVQRVVHRIYEQNDQNDFI
ncbi:Gfo/Idh/MocA family protein [Natronorubrum sp. DTA7]|uniref:Gfo/Idh/MocA family protein n=1 Tax=Natronorubrum sp. DTA7 TaxID=3447016 RepID=UPI003F852AB2